MEFDADGDMNISQEESWSSSAHKRIEASVVNCLKQVLASDMLGLLQIRNRACDFQNAKCGARG